MGFDVCGLPGNSGTGSKSSSRDFLLQRSLRSERMAQQLRNQPIRERKKAIGRILRRRIRRSTRKAERERKTEIDGIDVVDEFSVIYRRHRSSYG